MKHERATEEIRELAILHVLGSLTQHEAQSFETHMQEGCPVCQAEHRRYARTLAEMGFAAEEATAPDYLRDLLLARIEREGRPSVAEVGPKDEARAETLKRKSDVLAHSPLFATQAKREKSRVRPWILILALLTLAAAAGYYIWKSSQETVRQLQAGLSASEASEGELRNQVANYKEKAEGLEEIWVIVNRQGARLARLIGQAKTPSNVGAVLWDTQQGQCLVMGSLIPAEQGKTYQLWFFSAAKKVSVGLLKADAAGRFFMKLPVPKDAENATAVVVTLEPEGGSQVPTSPYSAAGRID